MKSSSSTLLAALAASVVGSACAASAQQTGAAPAHASRDDAVIEGRIDPGETTSVSDLRVAIYRVGDDGKLVSLARQAVKTDQRGHYRAHIEVPKTTMVNLVIIADRPGTPGQGMAVVPSWSVVDGVIIAPTIDLETAVESDVYLAAAKSGVWVANLGTNELRSIISGRLAQGLRASPEYKQDIAVMAQASVAAIESWYRTLLDPSNGLEPVQVEAVFEAMAWAQVALDAQIYSAKTRNDVQEAHAIHAVAVNAAYASVGIGPEHLALAGQSAADALRKFAHAMSGPLQSMLISEAESLRARYVIGAVDSLLSRAGAPVEEREEVQGAGMRLAGKLMLAAEAENPAEFVRRAWREYQAAVQGRLDAIAGGEEPGVPDGEPDDEVAQKPKEEVI